MGFFDSIQKPGFTAAKGKNVHIKQEIVKTALNPQKTFAPFPQHSNKRSLPGKKPIKVYNQTPKPSPKSRAQHPRKRLASTPQRLESDSDDDVSDQDLGDARKRARRTSNVEPDIKRQIRSRKAFSEEDGGVFPMVHAEDVASLSKPTKYKAAFPNDPQAIQIHLQYPSASQSEKYELVVPILNDDFKALEDIREVMETIISNYLPGSEAAKMQNDSTGLIRRLKRATERRAGNEYTDFVQEWNDTLVDLRKDGTISKTIDEWKRVDLKLLERILTQTYSRTVSPRVHTLRHYQNGTDNVYGELLPKFISLILKQDVKMKSDQIFVDLGSGVGNCVLQAALEVGCESWGCEMMDNACDLAELQEKEFNARCRLWGLSAGDIHLERGDFLKNPAILKILQKADVVLVNNQAFTPNLNEDLTNLFLDLKEGAKIVSLKSFVPHGHKITSKNLSAACNRLEVVQKTYFSACVSWTETAGTYYISTKDSSKVQAFAEKNM
ncbi:Nucleosomal histone H3-Lys79 methylase [Imshaugia aleurites]|uniref:Histone-lysine N-methyltransferase, H3 lysine-79 specific n=1 Tax=Imshaugia aleurites TaxID=172621 RepID=A0A8H3I9U2_9LECA|nr:Nucleosomal histone H3-Lys79 methylase [Imshaugia aleurites]